MVFTLVSALQERLCEVVESVRMEQEREKKEREEEEKRKEEVTAKLQLLMLLSHFSQKFTGMKAIV